VRLALAACIALVGCGELTGAGEYSDAAFAPTDTGRADTAKADASALNVLQGDYNDEEIPETRAALRLVRRDKPSWIVFVSNTGETPVTCEMFRPDKDWNKHVPAGSIIHVVELGKDAVGDYPIEKISPPTPDRAVVGRTQQTETALATEKAIEGSVKIVTVTPAQVAGSFEATFLFYSPEDLPDAPPRRQLVRGMFDVASCAVDW
jgi:hypothetical protein